MKRNFIKQLSDTVKVDKEQGDLGKLVKSFLSNRQGVDKRGFYASVIPYMECTRKDVLRRIFGEDTSNKKSKASFVFDIGTAAHAWWQNQYLGPMNILVGEWVCSRCHDVVKNSLMPTTPCEKCSWDECANVCVWGTHGKNKVESYDNYLKVDRDCISCIHKKGRWKYEERRLLLKDFEFTIEGKKIKTPFEISAHAHAFLQPPNGLVLADLKTKNSYMWKNLTSPDKKNLEQVNFMLGMSGIKKGMLVYLEKEAWKIKQYEFDFDQKLYDRSLKKVHDVMYGITYILYKLDLLDILEKWNYVYEPLADLVPLKKSDVIFYLDEIYPSRVCSSIDCSIAKDCSQSGSCFLTKVQKDEVLSWDIKR